MSARKSNASAVELERVLFHWPYVVAHCETEWAPAFATSIARQAKRRNWKPLQKQWPIMCQMVRELFAQHASISGDDLAEIE